MICLLSRGLSRIWSAWLPALLMNSGTSRTLTSGAATWQCPLRCGSCFTISSPCGSSHEDRDATGLSTYHPSLLHLLPLREGPHLTEPSLHHRVDHRLGRRGRDGPRVPGCHPILEDAAWWGRLHLKHLRPHDSNLPIWLVHSEAAESKAWRHRLSERQAHALALELRGSLTARIARRRRPSATCPPKTPRGCRYLSVTSAPHQGTGVISPMRIGAT